MITEGTKNREKKRRGCVSKAAVPPCGARVGWTRSSMLGTGHLITAGKLEESRTAESAMKALLGLAWGERLKDWNMYRLGKWWGSPPPHAMLCALEGGESSSSKPEGLHYGEIGWYRAEGESKYNPRSFWFWLWINSEPWNSLPKEAAEGPSCRMFKWGWAEHDEAPRGSNPGDASAASACLSFVSLPLILGYLLIYS